jgi:GMP synthase-like glutamine amidotransferase
MRIVCLQHVEYETPDEIATWAADRGHAMHIVMPLLEEFPSTDTFDMLVVLGGPMGAYEDARYPWLASEKRFIRQAIDAGKLVFGVCLGAQLTAIALGGEAHRHDVREVGWFPARLTEAGRRSRVLSVFPDEFDAGLWHGDTYTLPAGIETAAVTEGCPNQAFEARDGRVVGLQFHPEWTAEALCGLVERHPDWIEAGGPYVQTAQEILGADSAIAAGNRMLYDLLDAMEALR